MTVSHGTAIHMMLLYMRGMEFGGDLWTERVGNCNVTVVHITGLRDLKSGMIFRSETDNIIK